MVIDTRRYTLWVNLLSRRVRTIFPSEWSTRFPTTRNCVVIDATLQIMCADTRRTNTVLIDHIIRNSRGSRKNSKNRRKRFRPVDVQRYLTLWFLSIRGSALIWIDSVHFNAEISELLMEKSYKSKKLETWKRGKKCEKWKIRNWRNLQLWKLRDEQIRKLEIWNWKI